MIHNTPIGESRAHQRSFFYIQHTNGRCTKCAVPRSRVANPNGTHRFFYGFLVVNRAQPNSTNVPFIFAIKEMIYFEYGSSYGK